MRMVILLALALLCSFARADIIFLRDGTRIEGDLKRGEDGYDITDTNGKVAHVGSNEIQSIQLGKSASSLSALDKLASLRRSTESLDDLNKIIQRYAEFISQNKGTPAAAQAQKDLAGWQEKLDQHMVKVAAKWVTPEQQEQMLAQSGEIVKQAYDLMKANRMKEAEPILKQALAIDPNNPLANYLEGVLLFRGDKIVLARKSFEITHAQIPSDAATLNNLAVCAWRQNQFVISLGFYCDAMLAMPANKEIINNVAEALAMLKDDFKKNPTAQRASRLFLEQEGKLETTMAKYGWYRWGSTWLDQAQLDELKKQESQIKDKEDKLQKDFDDTKNKIQDNKDRMDKDAEFKADIENTLGGYDQNTGMWVHGTYPGAYYDAIHEMERLDAENQTLAKTLDQYRAEAVKLEGIKPKPKYTGVQNLIGVEGTPRLGMIDAASPTSQPDAAPLAAPAPKEPATAPAGAASPAPPSHPTTSSVF